MREVLAWVVGAGDAGRTWVKVSQTECKTAGVPESGLFQPAIFDLKNFSHSIRQVRGVGHQDERDLFLAIQID